MFEKCNPAHPDKIADRISGAIVDLAYTKNRNRWSNDGKLDLSTAEGRQRWAQANPKVAVEVLLGHGKATVMIESSEDFRPVEIDPIVRRLAGDVELDLHAVRQDPHLANNQEGAVRCGDNGIFRGSAPTYEQKVLTAIAASIYDKHPSDGKYLIGKYKPNIEKAIGERGRDQVVPSDEDTRSYAVTICQSNATYDEILKTFHDFFEGNGGGQVSPHVSTLKTKDGLTKYYSALINPLGEWTGGPDVDCGATNRKLGSDMGDGVTGGGLHGKDLSKGDVSINIVCFLKAVQSGQTVTACCSIGDEHVTFQYASGKTETETFADVVEMARLYILTDHQGSFERFAMWGLIAPPAL